MIDGHDCAHDRLPEHQQAAVRTIVTYDDHPHVSRRLATASDYKPIRIKVVYDTIDSSLSPAAVDFLKNKLVPAAVSFYKNALQVVPVSGNLYAERQCTSVYPSTGKCASYADPTRCGDTSNSNEVVIPTDYLKAQEQCTSTATGFNCVTLPAGTGVADADFVLFVTATETTSTLCQGTNLNTLAYASYCQTDFLDRPIFARANFCPGYIDPAASAWPRQYSVAIHEMAHALGFSRAAFPYFRDPSGNPRTPRGSDGNPTDAYKLTFTCNGASMYEYIPAQNTVKVFSERGLTSCNPVQPSSCVRKLVTPKATAAAQAFFKCPSLAGAELENQPTTSCSIVGSHWEQRIFMQETMASVASHSSFYSAVTLAALEDSSWYKANYSVTDPLQVGVSWGFQQGCSFAVDKCLDTSRSPVSTGSPSHFCTDTTNTRTCTLDRKAQALCNVATWSSALPTAYQYFSNPAQGGNLLQSDYCPYAKSIDNRVCTQPEDLPNPNYMGQVFGDDSMCFQSTLSQNIGGRVMVDPTVGCYQVTCKSSTWLQVSVVSQSGVKSTFDCHDGTTTHTASGFSGSLTCIDPAVYCGPKYTAAQLFSANGSIAFTANTVNVAKADSSVSVSVSRLFGSKGTASVAFATADGTAKAGTDYTAVSSTVSWADGDNTDKTVLIQLKSGRKAGSSFVCQLTSAKSAALLPSGASMTVTFAQDSTPKANGATTLVVSTFSLLWVCFVATLLIAGHNILH